MAHDAGAPLPDDTVGLLEGLTTTRAIRRYTDEPVPSEALAAMLFAATRAPSGSNRQPFRFLVLRDGPRARQARRILGEAAREIWRMKRDADGYDRASGRDDTSPKARLRRTMERYVETFEDVPVVVLACFVRYREPTFVEGASIYPACQNLLLAARALGYGGVMTLTQYLCEQPLKDALDVPDDVTIKATITLGRPEGAHGTVRRRPLRELVFEDGWGATPDWALDPPETGYTQAGPPPGGTPPTGFPRRREGL